ncbi:MAG TPA: TonB-dependent receptor [Vicinamibacterales bacterium]|nr:TonB-dependent receptor [Vicinamibacterales bacterium]
MRRGLSKFGLALLLLGVAAVPVWAQRTAGTISGTVMDTTGAVLPGVSVTAVCTETNLTRTVITDTQGGYTIPDVPGCLYRVTAELAGFKTIAREAPVAANSVAKTDFRLEVGAVSETVTVEGVSPLVEYSDKLNNRVDSARIESLPLSGRDFNSLLNVMPGVQHRPGGGFQGVNIGGARTSSNNFMIDGISNNEVYYGDTVLNQTAIIGIPATLVPMDAIGDFTVQQTPSAEFGVKGGAAINIVMKSGTNMLHGTAYYFRHDDRFDSANFFDIRAAQKLGKDANPTPIDNQQYGGTFGGPIVKDKAFFFGYYEGQRLNVVSPYDVHVPTDAQVATARQRIAAAGLQTSPIGEALIKFYPTDPSGNQHINGTTIANMNTFSIKVDHHLNAKNSINERVFYGRSFQSSPAGNSGEIVPPNQPVDLFNSVTDPTTAALVGVVWDSMLSNSTLLETRFGFNRFWNPIGVNNTIDPNSLGINTGPLDPANFGVPGVTTPFGHIGGVSGYPIFVTPSTDFSLAGSLSHTRGGHTLKVGGSWDRMYNKSIRDQARTSLTANGRTSNDVDALVGLLLARFEQASRSFGSTERNMTQKSGGAYINDDWKLSPRFTLSLGLRYELAMPITERNNLATNFLPNLGLVQLGTSALPQLYKADKNNFGPRAGFAWDPAGDGRTSVRAGYALTYDTVPMGTLHPGLFNTPPLGVFSVAFSQSPRFAPDNPGVTCLDPNNSVAGGDYICLQPGVPIFGSSPTGAPPFNITAVRDDFHLGYYHYFHATVQREVFRNSSVTASYVGSRGMDLVSRVNINAPPLGSPTSGAVDRLRPFFAQYPQYRNILEFTNDGRSWFDSLQLSFRQNMWHGINTQYNYTLSKCTDYQSTNRAPSTLQATNPYDPTNDKGPCTFDIRHNFNLGGSYSVPGTSIGGQPVAVGAVFTALSGRPFTPGQGSTDNSGQVINAIRANCLVDPLYNYDLNYLFPDPSTSRSAITNAAQAFANPAPGTLGTCGRDSGRGPAFRQLDLNIVKEFKLSSGSRVQARWEIFNLTNQVNLGGFLSTNTRSSSFGKIGSTPDVDRGNPVLGTGGPRAMQWAVKLLF